jgi:hypothetical protein
MKYYCYISNAKLNMLFPQIPRRFLDGLSGELSVNVGLIKTTLKDRGLTPTRLSKLEVVSQYIENNLDVGHLAAKHSYIKDTLEMHTVFAPERGIALFTHYSPPETVADGFNAILLSGSLKHVIGMESVETLISNSNTFTIVNELEAMSEKQKSIERQLVIDNRIADQTVYQPTYIDAILRWSSFKKGPVQKYEFLAKTLVADAKGDDRVLLATPIYVSLVD